MARSVHAPRRFVARVSPDSRPRCGNASVSCSPCRRCCTRSRAAFLGGLLITGYLGGAIAAHVRVGEDMVGPTIAAIAVAAIVWGGLRLRDARFRALTLAR